MKNEYLRAYDQLNDTVWDAPFETVGALFESRVREHPERIAAAGTRLALTYEELNDYANRVANALIAGGIGREDLIMVLLPRNIMYYAVNLGILKAGAAFLTVSPGYPDERLQYIFENAGCRCMITTRRLAYDRLDLLIELNKRPLFLENLLVYEWAENPAVPIAPGDLAYCIYTSGSTGKPKGVMIEHGNLSNFLQLNPKNHEVTAIAEKGSVLLANAALTFDVSLMEELIGLCSGMTVVMASDAEILNPLLLTNLMGKYGVDAMCGTPSYLKALLSVPALRPALRRMKVYDIGAEAFPGELYGRLREASAEAMIINGYGPTETTISCLAKEITSGEGITIGRPTANVSCYIVGKEGEILPPGKIGELLICGKGVGRGYRNEQQGNSAAFTEFHGMRAYRSGDLACLNGNGEIEFHGRTDNQVKLKGLRIELGEIEEVMARCPVIGLCAALPIENRYLCLYYTVREECAVPEDAEETIRQFAGDHLAGYMVPDCYMRLDTMPISANWKIDRKKLPKPEIRRTKGLAPETEIQKYIWESISSVCPDCSLGTNTDLTLEGISSLDWMLVIAAIGEQYEVSMDLSVISQCKTILGLEQYILERPAEQARKEVREARATVVQGIYYYLQQLSGLGETVMTVMLRMDPSVRAEVLAEAVRRAAAVHPGLFARFEERPDSLYIIAPESAGEEARRIPVEVIRTAASELPEVCSRFTEAPVPSEGRFRFRFVACETGEETCLLASFPHVLGDGASVSILLDDTLRALDGREIKEETMNVYQADQEIDLLRQMGIGSDLMSYYGKLFDGAVWPDFLTEIDDPDSRADYIGTPLNVSRADCSALSRKFNISETVLFAGLTVLALSAQTGGRKVPLLVAYNGRADYRVGDTFGFLVRPVLICPDPDATQSAAAFFGMTSRQYFEGISQQWFPAEEMCARYPGWTDHLFVYQATDESHTLFGRNVEQEWLEREDEESPEGSALPAAASEPCLKRTAARWAERQMGYEIYAEWDELTYVVEAPPSGKVQKKLLREIAEHVDLMCRRLAENQDVSVGELLG